MVFETTPNLSYTVDPIKKVILEKYEGPVSVSDIIEFKKLQVLDPLYNNNYNCITDLRKANLLLSFKEIKDFSHFFNSNSKLNGVRRSALLTSTPKAAAISLQFKNLSSNSNIQFEVFTTLEACIKWINMPKDDFFFIRNAFETRAHMTFGLTA